jgi:hypothetical protein
LPTSDGAAKRKIVAAAVYLTSFWNRSAKAQFNAYLQARRFTEAIEEFQRILSLKGLFCSDPACSLARVDWHAHVAWLARAKSRAAYETFFALWKDADADIPILSQAKTEYSKLY